MKYVKMIGLAALAMALMAFAGVGSASATTLDDGNGNMLPAGTRIHADMVGSAELTDTSGNPLDTCTGGTVEGTTTNTGSASETVKGHITAAGLLWGTCTAEETLTDEGGELEIHWISGTHNGTLTAKGFTVTVKIFGVKCIYGAGAVTDLGTLTGSDTDPVMDIHAVVFESGGKFLCPDTGFWNATYTVTDPKGLTVTES
jgi:hypothetical protein